jgi:hypothetical protein
MLATRERSYEPDFWMAGKVKLRDALMEIIIRE